MKFLFSILIICFLAEFSYALDKEEAKKIFMAAADTCKSTTGVSEDDIAKFKNHELVESTEGKCFATCVMKALAIMTPDNKINKQTILIGISLMYPNDPENAKKAEDIVDECIDISDENECEASYKIGECWKAGKEAKGLETGAF